MKSKRVYVIGIVGLLLLVAAPLVIADSQSVSYQLAQVRNATAAFHDVNAAAAAGYGQFLGCMQMPGQGAMGFHFVNGTLAGDATIDALHPEAVLYEQRGSELDLTAVEYVVMVDAWQKAGHTTPPSLFGQTFSFTDSPNMFGLPPFYSLHVWLWKVNPSGEFAAWNPAVSCPAATQPERLGTAR